MSGYGSGSPRGAAFGSGCVYQAPASKAKIYLAAQKAWSGTDRVRVGVSENVRGAEERAHLCARHSCTQVIADQIERHLAAHGVERAAMAQPAHPIERTVSRLRRARRAKSNDDERE
jgi:hypothetical protein